MDIKRFVIFLIFVSTLVLATVGLAEPQVYYNESDMNEGDITPEQIITYIENIMRQRKRATLKINGADPDQAVFYDPNEDYLFYYWFHSFIDPWTNERVAEWMVFGFKDYLPYEFFIQNVSSPDYGDRRSFSFFNSRNEEVYNISDTEALETLLESEKYTLLFKKATVFEPPLDNVSEMDVLNKAVIKVDYDNEIKGLLWCGGTKRVIPVYLSVSERFLRLYAEIRYEVWENRNTWHICIYPENSIRYYTENPLDPHPIPQFDEEMCWIDQHIVCN